MAAVPPIDYKLRYQILRELSVDITHLQYVEHSLIRQPIGANGARSGIHL